MIDATPKKSGLRAMFGMRPNTPKEPGTRKKLSKKSSRMDISSNAGSTIADPRRQDSGSFSSQHSGDRARQQATLPTYEDATGLTPCTFRDDPYTALRPGPPAVPVFFNQMLNIAVIPKVYNNMLLLYITQLPPALQEQDPYHSSTTNARRTRGSSNYRLDLSPRS